MEATSSLFVEVMKKESLLGVFRFLEKSQFGLINFFSMFLAIKTKLLSSSSDIVLGLLTFWIQFITLLLFFKYINNLPDSLPSLKQV